MPKFYVQSEQVKVVLDVHDAQQAAVTAFQWWCDRQAEAMVGDNADDCQLGNEMLVSEVGFGADDAKTFAAFDILTAWQVCPASLFHDSF